MVDRAVPVDESDHPERVSFQLPDDLADGDAESALLEVDALDRVGRKVHADDALAVAEPDRAERLRPAAGRPHRLGAFGPRPH